MAEINEQQDRKEVQPRPDIPINYQGIKTAGDKADGEFRVYDEDTSPSRVIQHYKDMRIHHTVDFYRRMEEKYSFANGKYRRMMTIDEAFAELEHYVVSHFVIFLVKHYGLWFSQSYVTTYS